jgi:preprotein translocase subunit SecE
MAIKEDVKGDRDKDAPVTAEQSEPDADEPETQESAATEGRPDEAEEETHDVAPVGAASPTQLGTKRFVYAAYFAGAITIAFLMSKILDFAWLKLQSYKPAIGEPKDELIMPAAALIGTLAAVYYWYRTRARALAEEVATEMSKVTWPSRTEVTNGTVVVIVTTVVSTVFFALMDKFWGFVTNLVYGGT